MPKLSTLTATETTRGQTFTLQAAVRTLPAGQLGSAAEGRLAAAFQRHKSFDWFDYETVDIGELHPQLLDACAKL
jgi:hypothetical protein